MVIQVAPGGRPRRRVAPLDAGPIGWGSREPGATDPAEAGADGSPVVVDIAMAPDATLSVAGWRVAAADLVAPLRDPGGTISIQPLAPADVRVEVRISADGEVAPARVRFVAADGRYLPPLGHREEINPATFEDTGAGLILGGDTYAYVPGTFSIDLPPGAVEVEVVKGFDHRPIRTEIVVDGGDARARARARTRDRPAGRRLGVRGSARPLPGAVDRPAPGGRRGRHARPPARDPARRRVHQRHRPVVGRPRGPGRPPHGPARDREPPEHARPPGPARRPPARPADGVGWRPGGPRRRGRRGAPRRLGGPLPRRWRARRRGALPAATGRDRGGHRRRPDRRDRDADLRPRARQPDRPRVVPLPQLRLPAAGPRRHRQDVRRDGRSAGSGRTPDSSPASRRRSRPGPPRCEPGGHRRPRARSSSSRSTATSRATSFASPRRAVGSRCESRPARRSPSSASWSWS